MPALAVARSASLAAVLLAAACDGTPAPTDAGPPDVQPASTAHCAFESLLPTAHAGQTVRAGPLHAGAAERPISIPVSATLGAYTARSEGFGHQGFVDDRRPPLAGAFAGSVGVETWPRVRAIALTTGAYDAARPTGDATILLIKADIGIAYQGHLHELEQRLGPEFAGQILFATSHSHSSFANYHGHSGMQVGFGRFRETAYEALLDDLEAVAREALANRRPAQIGIAYDGDFDPENRVNRDRRSENDDLPGGDRDDHRLYVIRVDAADGTPLAVVPIFGIHGIILGPDNVMVSGDAPAGIERVLEDAFEGPTVVMHVQGAGGDVSPAGHGGTNCDGRPFCQDFARIESVGWNARDAILATWEAAGASMRDSVEIEMVTRSIARGPDWRTFTIRDGELEYAPFDGVRMPDLVVWEDPDTRLRLVSPIDEFNAPTGAALCGGELAVPFGRMPGASSPELRNTPYASCNMLNERVVRLFETALDVELDTPPLCDTTRTTVSALRIGEHVIITLPGEPVTVLAERMRSLLPLGPERMIIIGYAQDHIGYLLTPEDWLRGGYEPNITFWGPLEGELIAEQAMALVPLVMTPDREEATADGVDRVRVPRVMDDIVADPLPATYGAPSSSPAYLLTRALPEVPSPQPAAEVRRLESVFFTWIGADPLYGTPTVVLEQESPSGTWNVVTRRSGRPVADGHILVTWTPMPLNPEPGATRVHYWTAEWQAVHWLDDHTAEPMRRLAGRVGVPLGRYRLRVIGPPAPGSAAPLYEVASDPFEVVAGAVDVRGSVAGTTLSLDLGYHAPAGYRLLDPVAGANGRFPIRGGTVQVSIDGGAAIDVAVDDEGRASVTVPASFAEVTIVDRFGNVGTFRR